MDLENISETAQTLIDFERDLVQEFRKGNIKGASHFSHGNESQLIKIFRGLKKGDYLPASEATRFSRTYLVEGKIIEVSDDITEDNPIFSGIQDGDWVFASYRNHYHALLKGISPDWLKREILDGRSMTPINEAYRFVTSGIVPGQIPIAVGTAKAISLKNQKNHVWAFCGDMAAETGVFYECAKYAQNHSLPLTFVIEDNSLSVDTPTQIVWEGQENNLRPNTIRYRYQSGVPHQGVGKEVGF